MALSRLKWRVIASLLALKAAASQGLAQLNCEDDSCIPFFGKCGGSFFNSSGSCCGDSLCVVKNFDFAQCLTERWAAVMVAQGWDGSVLECEEMPIDVIGSPYSNLAPHAGPFDDMDCEGNACAVTFEQCGGGDNTSRLCCDPDTECVVKNWYYAQCLNEDMAAHNVAMEGWDGRLLYCEETPEDAPKGPAFRHHENLSSEPANVVPQTGEGPYLPAATFIDPFSVFDITPTPPASFSDTLEECGGKYQECCGDGRCNLEGMECIAHLVQDARGVCMPCGGMYEPACSSDGVLPCKDDSLYASTSSYYVQCRPVSIELPGAPAVTIKPVALPIPAPTELPMPQTSETLVPPPASPPSLILQPSPGIEEDIVSPSPSPPSPPPTTVVSSPVRTPLAPQAPPFTPVPIPLSPPPTIKSPTIDVAPVKPPASKKPPIGKPTHGVPAASVAPSKPMPTEAFTFQGDLTYYGGAGVGGHCTQTYVPQGFTTVALNAPQYALGAGCGTCLYACFDNLQLGQGVRCIEAIVDDECPECLSGDLDLGEKGDGRWPVDWQIIQCPARPAGLVFTTQGSNPWYAKVKVQGGPSSVSSMTCNGLPGTPTPDAYFEFMSSAGGFACGMDCEVVYGHGFGTGTGRVEPAQLGGRCT